MQGGFVGECNFEAQARQAFANLDRVLAGFGITKSKISEMQIFLANLREHFELFAVLFREYVGDHRPAATLTGTTGLVFPDQLIEIRAVPNSD